MTMDGASEHLRSRLEADLVLWLTTTRRDGTPVSRPVWFVCDGDAIVVYSRPAAYKVAQLLERPRASVHFDGGAEADDIVVVDVRAEVIPEAAVLPSQLESYSSKYAAHIERLGLTRERYDALFTTQLRLEVLREVPVLDDLT